MIRKLFTINSLFEIDNLIIQWFWLEIKNRELRVNCELDNYFLFIFKSTSVLAAYPFPDM